MSDKNSDRVNQCGSCSQHEIIDHQQKKIDRLKELVKELMNTSADYRHKWSYQVELCGNLNKKLQAAEEELSNACELIKSLRELVIDLWENDASETDWLDVDRFHELIEKAEQALEKVGGGE